MITLNALSYIILIANIMCKHYYCYIIFPRPLAHREMLENVKLMTMLMELNARDEKNYRWAKNVFRNATAFLLYKYMRYS